MESKINVNGYTKISKNGVVSNVSKYTRSRIDNNPERKQITILGLISWLLKFLPNNPLEETIPTIQLPDGSKRFYLWTLEDQYFCCRSPIDCNLMTKEEFIDYLIKIFQDSEVIIQMDALFCQGYDPEEDDFVAGSKWTRLFITNIPPKHSGELKTQVGLWIKFFDPQMIKK